MSTTILTVFISYSWDSEEHKEWVLKLADKISILPGIHVMFDGYDLRVGEDKHEFMDKGIKESDKVLIILTPNYALKADNREGGVGEEYSIIRSDMVRDKGIIGGKQVKFLPILKDGDIKSSCPAFLERLINHDMRDETKFEDNFNDLLREIFDRPKIKRPDKQTELPDFLK